MFPGSKREGLVGGGESGQMQQYALAGHRADQEALSAKVRAAQACNLYLSVPLLQVICVGGCGAMTEGTRGAG